MNESRFKIGTLAKLTGFGVGTLRNWERRYGLLKPKRVSSGQRFYTLDDLSTLRSAKTLLSEGRAIGEIAALARDGLLPDESSQRELPEGLSTSGDLLPYFVLDALPCGIVLTDARGRTQWVNKSLERICGYGLAELRGRTPGSVLQGPRTDARTVQMIAQALSSMRACNARILNYAANQQTYWADLDIAPFLVGAEPRGFVATIRDVTDQVEPRSPKGSGRSGA